MRQAAQTQPRRVYGPGEWFGRLLTGYEPQERRELARRQLLPRAQREEMLCPFRSAPQRPVVCGKQGGVCSLRLYHLPTAAEGEAVPAGIETLCALCPYRFHEAGMVFRWIGERILGHADPEVVGEVGFLERSEGGSSPRSGPGDVGRIDHVLAHRGPEGLAWCALEMQAVYFSGHSMTSEFRALANWDRPGLPPPAARRRPDYRSSGPKRLMPQLQIKVPTLRRWGKKMCVVVDRNFFGALDCMETVAEVSNCDIAWFVVGYQECGAVARLVLDSVHLTTLERAVEGLTAGRPVSLATFEERIRAKLG